MFYTDLFVLIILFYSLFESCSHFFAICFPVLLMYKASNMVQGVSSCCIIQHGIQEQFPKMAKMFATITGMFEALFLYGIAKHDEALQGIAKHYKGPEPKPKSILGNPLFVATVPVTTKHNSAVMLMLATTIIFFI